MYGKTHRLLAEKRWFCCLALSVLMGAFFSLYVVWCFMGCYKTAIECDCFLGLHWFSASVSVWDRDFSPHAIHGSMQGRSGCVRKHV